MSMLSRVVIVRDGRCRAEFEDGVSLALDSSGYSMALAAPAPPSISSLLEGGRGARGRSEREEEEGEEIRRCLTQYAVSRDVPRLGQALVVRNACMEPLVVCPALLEQSKEGRFTATQSIRLAHWPRTVAEGAGDGRVGRTHDGGIVVKAVGDVAMLVLTADGLRFVVRFPASCDCRQGRKRGKEGGGTGESGGGKDGGGEKLEYVWVVQSFSSAEYPARWAHALALAKEALAGLTSEASTAAAMSKEQDGGAVVLNSEEKQIAPSENNREPGENSACDFTSRLPSPNKYSNATWLAGDDWWTSVSSSHYPRDGVLWIEWRPEACYQYLHARGEVEVVVAADSSVLRSEQCGKFFKHTRRCSDRASIAEFVFTDSTIPQTITTPTVTYELEQIVKRSLLFLQAAKRSAALHKPSDGPDEALGPYPSYSTVVKERQRIEGVGEFSAYKDGRTRVYFTDRTLLEIDQGGEGCSVLLPDGERRVVRTAAPVGVENYVSVALSFWNWARQSPEERLEAIKLHKKIAVEIARTKRAVIMNEFVTTGAVPPTSPSTEEVGSAKHDEHAAGSNRQPPSQEEEEEVVLHPASPSHHSVSNFSQDEVQSMLKQNEELIQRLQMTCV